MSWKASVPCDCGCENVLIWEFEPWGDEPHQVYVEFTAAYPADRLSQRLKAAIRILRRKDPWVHSITLQQEGIEQMRAAMSHYNAPRRSRRA